MPIRPLIAFATAALLPLTLSAADAPPIDVARSETRDIVQEVAVNGTVTSPRAAVLSPSVGGLIEDVAVDAGDRVEAGAVLVALDRELGELTLARFRAEAAQARTSLEDARRRLAEAVEVGPERGISESEIKSRRAAVAGAEAALQAAEAAASQQAAVVRRHEVRAPFGGVVSQRLAEVGEWVNPGDALVELVATEGLRFDFPVPQAYFSRIRPDTPVTVTLDALPDRRLQADIRAIVPVNDPRARTFLLRVTADTDGDVAVTPGMSARAGIRIDTGRRAVTVPRDALLRYPDGRKTVWVTEADSGETRVREQLVDTGLEFDGVIEIRDGLESGLTVVTRGNESLQDGQSVRIR
jgi:RND family efflux transporter MFP subunit